MCEEPSTECVEVCPECDTAGPRTVVGHPIAPGGADHDYRCPACGARFDEPDERPREADAGRPSGLAGELYDRDPEDVGEPVTDGGLITAAEADHYTDGSFTTCPDCGGDLQYQNRESVVCLECATQFGHYKRTNGLNTLLRAPDNDRAARVYDPGDDECRESEIVTDGGYPEDEILREAEVEVEHHVSADGVDTHTDLYVPSWAEAMPVEVAERLWQEFDIAVQHPPYSLDLIGDTDEELVTDGGRTWDGRDCPRRPCDGELQQQDERNVACLACGEAWSHVVDDGTHLLVSAAGKIIKRLDPATDGGQDTVYLRASNRSPAQTYHRERDCRYLQQASSVVERSLSFLPGRVDPCSVCATEDERVLVSSSAGTRGNTTYHTDPDCGYVQRMAETVRKPLTVLADSYEPCSDCVTGEADRGGDYEETYTCDYCGEGYRSLPAALRCCGDRLAKESQGDATAAAVERREVEQ